MKLFKLLILFLLVSHISFSQERSIYGRVVDSTKYEGINGLIIQNKTSGQLVNTNKIGEFYVRGIKGDSLIIMDIGYNRVGVVYDGINKYPVIATKQQPIMLQEVVINEKRMKELQEEINNFLVNPNSGGAIREQILANLVSTQTTTPGIGISIDGLYELWSKKGKVDRRVADLKYNDIKEFYVDLKYNKRSISQITKLEDHELDDFMQYCKPYDDFILRANEYELTHKILTCLKEFRTTRVFRKTK